MILISATFDIVIPVFDPPQGWTDPLLEFAQDIQQKMNHIDFHFIIVDDGSSRDLSNDIADLDKNISSFTHLSNESNQGKGATLRAGISHGSGRYVLFTDADIPYTMGSVMDMITCLLENECNVVIADRSSSYFKKLSIQRRLISGLLKFLNKVLIGLPITDTQAGLKAFDTKGKEVFLSTLTDRFLIDLEFIKLAYRRNLHIAKSPVKLSTSTTVSNMNVLSLIRELPSFLRILFL